MLRYVYGLLLPSFTALPCGTQGGSPVCLNVPQPGHIRKLYINSSVWACNLLAVTITPALREAARVAKRGLRHRELHTPKSRLRTPQVRKATRQAIRDGRHELARFFAVARLFMPRVANESAPLQLDGRAGLADGDAR